MLLLLLLLCSPLLSPLRRQMSRSAEYGQAAHVPLPPLPVAAPGWSFLVNLGLPRSGTTSFAFANAIVGMRARHGWCQPHEAWDAPCARKPRQWPNPSGTSRVEVNMDEHLHAYDSLSDLPFFLVERAEYARRARSSGGSVRFVCTMRAQREWIDSMLAHGSAGGTEMLSYAVAKLNVSRPRPSRHALYSNYPHDNRTRALLVAFYDWHAAHVCHTEGERIWAQASDDTKWAVLCEQVPSRFAERCWELKRRKTCWPHLYAKMHANASRENTREGGEGGEVTTEERAPNPTVSADNNVSASTRSCTPWRAELCSRRMNSRSKPLPRNRTDEGSLEGGIEGEHDMHHVVCTSSMTNLST